ncbi:MAG: hypothetical protein AB1894_20005 [Chloroflexota bacterium]
MTDPVSLQTALQHLQHDQLTTEDLRLLREAIGRGEVSVTGRDQISVGDTHGGARVAIGDGASATVNFNVPPEALERLLVRLEPRRAVSERRELEAWRKAHLQGVAYSFARAQQRLRERLQSPPPPAAPYKGLNYFEALDQAIFFGRQAIAGELVERLLRPESRLMVLHAPSGAGKTSLIRAGLMPRLLQRGCCTLCDTLSTCAGRCCNTGAAGRATRTCRCTISWAGRRISWSWRRAARWWFSCCASACRACSTSAPCCARSAASRRWRRSLARWRGGRWGGRPGRARPCWTTWRAALSSRLTCS